MATLTSAHRDAPADAAQGKRVVIVGAGVAGIAAAVRLADAGVGVSVVETRKRLGGRATSFTDPDTGQLVDNCQHVLMRGCTHLIDLYQRLGVDDRIAWHRRLNFLHGDGTLDALEADDLPAPLHLLRPLWAMSGLSFGEKLAVSRGMLAIMQVCPSARARLGDESFLHWLQSHGQPQAAIDRFWSVVITSACNETPDRTAANYALQVFQEGFLCRAEAYEMGLATVPLAELYDPADRAITRAGGEVLTGASATGLAWDGQRVTHVKLADGQEVFGDVFVSALPFDRLEKLVSPDMVAADSRLARLGELEVSPILGIHLTMRRPGGQPVLALPHVALTDSPLHWVFDKGPDDATPRGQRLHGVVSAAHDLMDRPADDIAELAAGEVRRLVPGAADAELVRHRVIKEKRATFSVQPGIDRLRPGTTGAIGNLLLAGDWTDTGWPATMEGAARSGHKAAAAALAQLGVAPHHPHTPDLEPGPLYRLMCG